MGVVIRLCWEESQRWRLVRYCRCRKWRFGMAVVGFMKLVVWRVGLWEMFMVLLKRACCNVFLCHGKRVFVYGVLYEGWFYGLFILWRWWWIVVRENKGVTWRLFEKRLLCVNVCYKVKMHMRFFVRRCYWWMVEIC